MKKRVWPTLALAVSMAATVVAAPSDTQEAFPELHTLASASGAPFEVEAQVHKTLRQWFVNNLHLSNPKEAPLWEGVADWMADDAVDQAHPDWQRGLLDASIQAKTLWDDEDGSVTAPPVLTGGHGSAHKAEALLRMVDGYLGRNAVRLGLQNFVTTYDGRPVTSEDLWNAIQAKAGTAGSRLHLAQVMEGWLDQPGFPLVVSKVVNSGKTSVLSLYQEGFTLYPGTPPDNKAAEWAIPLWIRYEDNSGVHDLRTVLEQKTREIPLPAEGRVTWAYPNAGGMGFYRTDIPDLEWRVLLSNGLPQLSENERVALLSNQWRLVRHGTAPVSKFLEVVQQTSSDADPDIEQIDLEELDFQSTQVRPEDRELFNRMVLDVFTPFISKWGIQPKGPEPQSLPMTRYGVVQMLAKAGDSAAQQELQSWTERWLKGDTGVWDWMVAVSDDSRVFDKLAARFKTNPTRDSKMDTLQTLSQLRGTANASRYVSLVLSTDVALSDADKGTALLYPLRLHNPEAMDQVWTLLKTRWDSVPSVDAVAAAYAESPYRFEAEHLVASRGTDSTKEALGIMELKGPGATLAYLPEQLHDWLHHTITAPPPPQHKHKH